MSGYHQGSDRRSDRVEEQGHEAAGQGPAAANKGQESRALPGGARTPAAEGGQRIGAAQLRLVAASLTDRDRAVLASLATFGFLRTSHLQTLHFAEHATEGAAARICRRVLARLRDHRLIEPIERRIGGLRAGSASFVWRLGPAGDRLLREGDETAPRARRAEPSLRFLEHRLAVAGAVCALTIASREQSFDLLSWAAEPGSWRPFAGLHGAREILKPDLCALTASGEYEDHWFIEVDRGTESLPTVLKQCAQYERYRRSGREQQARGIFPRVLWLVPSEHRASRLRQAIQQTRDLDAALYRVALSDQLVTLVSGGAQ